MTIRKRLAHSNIAMLVIPLLTAAVLALLIVINVRQSRDEKRREAARRKGAMQP